MAEKVKLKPAREGLLVRHVGGKQLAAAGELVELNTHWRRRLAAGDVVQVAAASAAARREPAAEKKER